jgi:hypothetical protein
MIGYETFYHFQVIYETWARSELPLLSSSCRRLQVRVGIRAPAAGPLLRAVGRGIPTRNRDALALRLARLTRPGRAETSDSRLSRRDVTIEVHFKLPEHRSERPAEPGAGP